MNLAFSHEPGTAIACLSIPIILHKEGPPGIPETDLKCGFKIGGGIDQDYKKSPQVRWQFKIKFDLESIGSSLGIQWEKKIPTDFFNLFELQMTPRFWEDVSEPQTQANFKDKKLGWL